MADVSAAPVGRSVGRIVSAGPVGRAVGGS